jgi:hypothetical protein
MKMNQDKPLKEGGAKKTDFVVCSCQNVTSLNYKCAIDTVDAAIY